MFSFRTTPFLEQPDLILKKGRIAILCNQVAWHPDRGEYLFETLAKRGNLVRIFTPEHSFYGIASDKVETIEVKERIDRSHLEDIDGLVIELQDAGARYSTVTSLIFNIFNTIKQSLPDMSVYILDRFNPAGRQIEGTMGKLGLPHRHGLTIGEMASMFYNDLNAKFPLHIISANAETVNKELMAWTIPPFTDFAGLFTSNFYSGQCLWMGTNVSYGHGTTRPFEQFGAPYMERLFDYNRKNGYLSWNDPSNPLSCKEIYIRWTRFTPAYGIYAGEICFGFQLMFIPGAAYHAFNHQLRIMRFIAQNCPEFDCGQVGQYLEDEQLMSFIEGKTNWESASEYIKGEEQKWLRKSKKFSLYGDEPYRIK